ncbi:hypothetical protein KBT16_26075 [Nostoc sp. CCCryo 231-06]|nr:hypothetical protein [Nostoc sp. CCCryo 231-06]
MSWRGSTTVSDRIFGSLPYLLPLIEVIILELKTCQKFSSCLLLDFPVIGFVLSPLRPLVQIYNIPYAGLIIFFALFFLIVRNEKISHFIRFNTMQAILLDIIIFLFSILTDVVGVIVNGGFATQTLSTTIFIGIIVAVVYSIAQSLLGRYAEIPAVSDAVYMQVR